MGTDRIIRIANEGLRLVMECKVPRLCSSAGYDQMVQLQREWSKRLPYAFPPLLEWLERHREVLFDEEWSLPAVQNFQKRFVLVFLEQFSSMMTHSVFHMNNNALESRLFNFDNDVRRILTTNKAICTWLFHYYGSELGLQGWQCRPGDLYGFYYLFHFLGHSELDVLFGRKLFSLSEQIGKELMGVQQNSEFQSMGALMMANVMFINYENQKYTDDAKQIFKMALRLSNEIGPEYQDELWTIICYSVSSFRDGHCSLDDEVMINLLAHLDEELVKKEGNPTIRFGVGPLTHLKALTLLLFLDVPEVDMKEFDFDLLTISGRECDPAQFSRHVKYHLRTTDNLRFTIDIRLRIAKLIPKLFAGFTSLNYVHSQAYNCLKLLTWLTMFPFGQTWQQNNARGIMLIHLLVEIKRVCEGIIKTHSEYSYGEEDLRELNANLHPLLAAVREGIKHLPNEGCFRRFKREMEMYITLVFFVVNLLKCLKVQVVEEEQL